MQVKIGDLGLAVYVEGEERYSSSRGTPHFMPPEMCRDEPFGRSCDIWSAGCVILHLLTNHRPWSQYDRAFQILFAVSFCFMHCVILS